MILLQEFQNFMHALCAFFEKEHLKTRVAARLFLKLVSHQF